MDDGLDSHAAALSKLIGLIYDTAGDQALWPQLLESMADYVSALGAETVLPFDPRDAERMVANWFDDSGALAPLRGTDAQKGVFVHLAPHFVRAFELQRQFAESDEHRRLLEAALDQLPLGIAVIEASGAIVSINSTLLVMLREHGCLAMSAGRLVSRPQKALADVLQQVLAEPGGEMPLRLDDTNGGLCIWVSRLMGDEPATEEARLAVWVASSNTRSLAESGLRKLFGTTPAETRLIQQLITGCGLDEAAQNLNISINTAKTQLKSVFEKVGVKRQSELVHAIYATPLWLKLDDAAPATARLLEPSVPSDRIGIRSRDSELTLPDGRRLAWSDTGAPDGLPVILMHAIAGSRHLRHPDDRILHEYGMRLIIPERPGIGDSDPLPGRRVRDWPKDVAALADHLELQRFVVLGYSGAGTPYAFATAQSLSDRVCGLFLVGAAPPIEQFKDLKMFSDQSRMPMLVARYSPNLLPPLLRVGVRSIKKNVYRYIEQAMLHVPESDRRVFDDPVMRENYARGLLASVKYGEQYLVSEALLVTHGWSADNLTFSIPVEFFHGDADSHVALDGARRLVERIPGARLHVIEGAGHFLIYSHWRELLHAIRHACATR